MFSAVLENLNDFKPIKIYNLRKNIEQQSDLYLSKISYIHNKSEYNLLSQVCNCSSADIQEFYSEISNNRRFTIKNSIQFNYEMVENLFKWFSFYKLLKFYKSRNEPHWDYSILLCLFDFTMIEVKFINDTIKTINISETDFELIFSTYILEELLNIKNDPRLLAFVMNFLYNSFEGFISSLNCYVSFDNNNIYSMN